MADDTNQPLFGQLPAVSPSSLALRRARALEMMKAGNDYSSILSKWQGAARVAQSIIGNVEAGMEDRAESEARKKSAEKTHAQLLAAGLDPKLASILSGATTDPWMDEAARKTLLEKSTPALTNTGMTLQPMNPLTQQPQGPYTPRQEVGTQAVGPGGSATMPTIIGGQPPGRPAGGQAPPIPPPNIPNTAAGNVQVPAGFNAMRTQPPQEPIEALAEKGRKLNDLYERQKMGIESRHEDYTRGMGAGERINAIRTLSDAYAAGGNNISGGPLGRKILEAKQLFHQLTDVDLGGTPESEIITHANQGLAGALARSLSSRGATNNEFNQMMAANPGVMMSNTGARYMLNLMEQQENQGQRLAIAGQSIPAENYAQFKQGFYSDPKNQLVSPFSGKPLAGAAVTEDMNRLKAESARGTVKPSQTGGGWTIKTIQ